jgi:glycosyltransferase involved in cell wall biosynthesis
MSSIAFSIVVPCYNEAENLPQLLAAYRSVWRQIEAELVLVDNGSTDHTADVLECELAKPEYWFARSIRVPKNRGYGFGVNAGLRATRGEVIGISHADMQCDPRDLFTAFELLKHQTDLRKAVVKGKRARRPFGPSLITNIMAVVASTVLWMRLTDINAQPKVFHRDLLGWLTDVPDGFELDLYLLYTARKNGLRVLTIPVAFGTRAHGASKWAFSLLSRWRHIRATLEYIFHLRFAAAAHGQKRSACESDQG